MISVPQEPAAAQLAPLLGAGTVAFQTLRSGIARAGDIVAIVGLGRVGLLALQFAGKLGFQTVAVSRGSGKTQIALKCGAHAFIDSDVQSVTDVLGSVGGAQAIVSTAPQSFDCGELLQGLADRGTLVLLQQNYLASLTFQADALCQKSRNVRGARFGTPWDTEETLRFAIANRIASLSDTVAFETLPEFFALASRNSSGRRIVTEPAK